MAKKKLLVVEDVELNRDLMVQLLKKDYEVITASDGAAGVELVSHERPDLILMDLSLPVFDGWEATRRIKALPGMENVPVIALTAHAMPGDEEKARAAGCDDYLTKPIDENLLFAKLREFLGTGITDSPTDQSIMDIQEVPASKSSLGIREVLGKSDKPVILVVDDVPVNIDYLEQELGHLGYMTVTATNGLEALDQVKVTSPDMILLDIMMPEMDGFEVLACLKSDKNWRDIPVIVISSVSDIESVVRGIELGADDYLPKPFDPTLLKARLSSGLERKRLRDKEVEYLNQVNRLTAAAHAVEKNTFEPESLALVAARKDALGGLARVFQRMAAEVHVREQRLKRQVEQLRLDIEEWGAAEWEFLAAYIPMDRRQVLARKETLPTHSHGAALFADISGYTNLADTLVRTLGRQRGVEEMVRQLNRIFEMLISEVHNFSGTVVNFAGDGIICWFDDLNGGASGHRATACALAMHTRIEKYSFENIDLDAPLLLSIKTVASTGSVRRFLIGDPNIQLLEVIAGEAVDEISAGGRLVQPNESLISAKIVDELGDGVFEIDQDGDKPKRKVDERSGARFLVISSLNKDMLPSPWPDLQTDLSAAQARPWLLLPVFEQIRTGKSHFLSGLRDATALFLQFWGIDFVHDEEAETKLDDFFRWVQSVVTKNKGIILHITIDDKGSYLYAVFGAPVAIEDDAACAVDAAQTLQVPPMGLEYITKVQIGMARGQMRVGSYGNLFRRMYAVLGGKANLAARLMQEAYKRVLCDEAVYRSARVRHEFEPLPPLKIKGFENPVPIYYPSGARARLNYHRQIDQLPQSIQFTIKVASIIGDEFDERILQAIYPNGMSDEQLQKELQNLVSRELIENHSEGIYRFRDVSFRDTLYESLLFGQRRQLHRAIAIWFEKTYLDDLSNHYTALIYHWKGAEDPTKTIHYLELAGTHARNTGRFEEALEFYDEARTLEMHAAILGERFFK